MNMYEWMYVYVYEIVSYRSRTKEKKIVINTHNIYFFKKNKHVNKTNKTNKLQFSFFI
jgi:wobble nucleotide-excising tRNase